MFMARFSSELINKRRLPSTSTRRRSHDVTSQACSGLLGGPNTATMIWML